jgi:hypothetical protein
MPPLQIVKVRHWLPILTFCPVNKLPDLLYVTVEWRDGKLHELYDVRRRMRKTLSGKCLFMEECALRLADEFPDAFAVTVSLAFGRHVVKLEAK